MSASAHTRYVKSLYKKCLLTAQNWTIGPFQFRPVALEIRAKFEHNKNASNPVNIQQYIREAEDYIEKNKHPLPYKYPTAVGGSKYERNKWFEKNDVYALED
ncbi:hypothetical protein BB560_006103 [Smittium megazygosporum]|uniref:NADH dehydrogenase [ubiquinone] 1 beta subcomplex subunit 9 n=1 Tax=Smittium megazygosporum TaxID=133381 RepID=A0A2T9YHL6_9FUNG|nr:hypothetical protein BB560_006103 [Smittium megazygosporum]